jgi:hypothetical protein
MHTGFLCAELWLLAIAILAAVNVKADLQNAAGGGVAVAWPLGAHAEQSERRIGVLMSTAADEPEGQARLAAFQDTLQQLAGPTAATCGSILAGLRAIRQVRLGGTI